MNHLEIKHLRMIRAMAATGNMTRAAEKLHVSQSALSQQLKDIENKLQVDLFHRTRKKMVLTSSGRMLVKVAEDIVKLLDGTELEIAKLVAGERGELKVGAHCIFCFKWLPGIMAGFRKQFPNVEIEIGISHDPAAELDQRKYHVIISAEQLTGNVYTQQTLFQDQLVCIMERYHPLASQSHVRLDDFQDLRLISHAGKNESRFYTIVLQPRGIEPRRYMTVGQPQAIVELVVAGLGVSIFPLWAVVSLLETGNLVAKPISGRGLPLTWRALSLKRNNVPVYQREFIRMIQGANIVGRNGPNRV